MCKAFVPFIVLVPRSAQWDSRGKEKKKKKPTGFLAALEAEDLEQL